MTLPTPPKRRRALRAWIGAAILIVAALGGWYLRWASTGGEIESLPANERHAFYVRTLEDLRTVCTRTSGPNLDEHCRDQARLLVRFPECDATCQEVAQRFLAAPNR